MWEKAKADCITLFKVAKNVDDDFYSKPNSVHGMKNDLQDIYLDND